MIENQDVKILWDFKIRTDGVTEARRPDIVLTGKKNQETFILNMTIPEDFRVRDKDAEKISRVWNKKLKRFL